MEESVPERRMDYPVGHKSHRIQVEGVSASQLLSVDEVGFVNGANITHGEV